TGAVRRVCLRVLGTGWASVLFAAGGTGRRRAVGCVSAGDVLRWPGAEVVAGLVPDDAVSGARRAFSRAAPGPCGAVGGCGAGGVRVESRKRSAALPD